jgi:hypothetical protein
MVDRFMATNLLYYTHRVHISDLGFGAWAWGLYIGMGSTLFGTFLGMRRGGMSWDYCIMFFAAMYYFWLQIIQRWEGNRRREGWIHEHGHA